MPDLLMCRNVKCPKRSECVRYRALPSVWQQYLDETPESSSCRRFEVIRGLYPLLPTWEIDASLSRKK